MDFPAPRGVRVSHQQSEDDIPVERRRTIFQALVEAQDGGLGVVASRAEIARRFSVTEDQMKEIEREGLANQWPPL
jgi:hypothetical protein